MDIQSCYNLPILFLSYLLGTCYFSSDSRLSLKYFGCHGIILHGAKSSQGLQGPMDTSVVKEHVSSTRILGYWHGPGHSHAVRISLSKDFSKALCAGAIHNALYIITAAHCVSNLEPWELIVTAGTGPQFPGFPKQNRSVVSFETYPDWKPDTLEHDIALLKLNHSLFISGGSVFPRELGPPMYAGGNVTDVWITGWGLTDGVDGNRYIMYDNSAQVTLVEVDTCKEEYRKLGKQLYDHQICARAKLNDTGPCTGDDGAPLMVGILYANNTYRGFLTGILSSFQDCAKGAIDIYTEIGNYKHWIESKAGRQCDFNIYANDDDVTRLKVTQKQFSKPKGRIDEGVARAVCDSFHIYVDTNKIQSPLKSAKTIRYRIQYVVPTNDNFFLCTNLQWSVCSGCDKFVRVKCRIANYAENTAQMSSRIFGGHEATPHQNPHHVRISKEFDGGQYAPHSCGGLIYNSMHVLTSANCVYKNIPCSLTVTAGDHSVSIEEDTEQIRKVVSINVHEHYEHDNAKKNNIALLRLDPPLNFTKHVHSLLLATKEYPSGEVTSVELTGWGFFNDSYIKSDVPHILKTPFVDDCNCRLEYSSWHGNSINSKKICAGARGSGMCIGDSGDPWTVQDGENKYVVALNSFTGRCGVSTTVGTKLSAYRDWIVLRAGTQDVDVINNNKYKIIKGK